MKPDSRPVRLQLRRTKGFRLQLASRAVNGLEAVVVARPTRWGNPWTIGVQACGCRTPGECGHNTFRCETAAEAVAAYRLWLGDWKDRERKLAPLRGRNLACWCKVDEPCHADVLLELANR